MSYEKNEINDLKQMLVELNKKVNDTLPTTRAIDESQKLGDKKDSENYLKMYELQVELEKKSLNNESLKKEIIALKNSKDDIRDKYNKNIDKTEYYKNKIEQYEKRNRRLFQLYSLDKEDMFKQQLLIEKLKQEIYNLKSSLDIQEQRYQNLKNQLSYRLGSRLVGLKKSKDLFKLPKGFLDDYISVKSKIKETTSLPLLPEVKPHLLTSIHSSSREYSIFNQELTLPLKSNLSTVIFNEGFKGSLDLELYGVKPSASVDIELNIRTHQGDCVFKVMPDIQRLYHLAKNETMTVQTTVNDEQAHQFIEIISTNGTMEISFKKKKGVPSFIHLIKVDDRNNNIVDSEVGVDRKIIESDIAIPKLEKKSLIFREAVDIQEIYGFETAKMFLNKYVSENQKSTINIFYANNELDNNKKWLSHLNKYITDNGMEPIQLRDNEKEKFYRIHSPASYKVEDSTKISVIMPAYNAEKTIELSMRSILNQTWKNLELIVINDCSADRTSEIIKKIASTDSRVEFIDNPCNVGAYVSKNLGLKIAKGDYITGHDADDWAYPQRLEQHMKLIRSEKTPPRASNTRMIRMEESGYLPLYPFGAFCHDGIMRVASITCMFEANFLRNTLGGWDCSRFGADSEIISRCKMVIGDEFKNYKALSMICLDEPTSLTNHPIHGVSKSTGISPSRKFYKEQWTEWHKNLKISNVYLEFPHLDRKFALPQGTEIPEENIIEAISNLESKVGSK